jgi:hypothetical protein
MPTAIDWLQAVSVHIDGRASLGDRSQLGTIIQQEIVMHALQCNCEHGVTADTRALRQASDKEMWQATWILGAADPLLILLCLVTAHMESVQHAEDVHNEGGCQDCTNSKVVHCLPLREFPMSMRATPTGDYAGAVKSAATLQVVRQQHACAATTGDKPQATSRTPAQLACMTHPSTTDTSACRKAQHTAIA